MPDLPHRTLAQLLVRSRFIFLLLCLIAVALLVPWLEHDEDPDVIVRLLLTLLLCGGVYAVAGQRRDLIIAGVLAVPTLLTDWTGLVTEQIWHQYADKLTTLAFILFLSSRILIEVYRDERVTANTILGAICAYLLVGWLFAVLFGFVELIAPGSIAGVKSDSAARSTASADFMYYSFVTLTTLGYGDITPIGPMARSLAYFEAMIGQLFPAVLIARFVGLHISQSIAERR